jgi:hypothetical protein
MRAARIIGRSPGTVLANSNGITPFELFSRRFAGLPRLRAEHRKAMKDVLDE